VGPVDRIVVPFLGCDQVESRPGGRCGVSARGRAVADIPAGEGAMTMDSELNRRRLS
jgi:hypothetical protein